MGSSSLLPCAGRRVGFPCANLRVCSPLGLEPTRWDICPILSEHAMEKHPLPASLSLPVLPLGTHPEKVILMCVLFSTCFPLLENSETKWGRLVQSIHILLISRAPLYFTGKGSIYSVLHSGSQPPTPPGVDNYKTVQFLLNFRVLVLLINSKSSLRKQAK